VALKCYKHFAPTAQRNDDAEGGKRSGIELVAALLAPGYLVALNYYKHFAPTAQRNEDAPG